ncbi:MAG: EutN/CcmL family microcompartment protein [Mahellales bacterium]|jgi:microcompartment protein CcmK/EutM
MFIGKVIGCVISTCKDKNLIGKKLMIVQPKSAGDSKTSVIAIDCVDAGVGDTVIYVMEGGSSRQAAQCLEGPVDAAIVGVVDYDV